MPRKAAVDAQGNKKSREKIVWRKTENTWKGRIRILHPDGSRSGGDWVVLGTTDRTQAQERYDHWYRTGALPPFQTRQTFAQAAEALYEREVKLKPKKAADRKKRLLAYVIPRIGMMEVAMMEDGNVAGVLDEAAIVDGLSRGSCLKLRSDISRVLAAVMRKPGGPKTNVAKGVSLPDEAATDTRERMALSDSQWVQFRKKRGFDTQIDMACLLCRDVGGHRGSDAIAADWSHCNVPEFTVMKVRRPKTDGEVGEKVVGGAKPRAYEMVDHVVKPHVRRALVAYWIAQGRPTEGPIFPTQRDGVGKPFTGKDGRRVERRASRAGSRKLSNTWFPKALRLAVWKAGIYQPLPGFDPEHPEKKFCAFQTDTKTTRRLTYQSVRMNLVTALGQAKTNEQTALAITGHTQMTTQLRHYMGRRVVEVPDGAIPGGVSGGGGGGDDDGGGRSPGAALAPESPRKTGSAPSSGAKRSRAATSKAANSPKSQASPRGLEPLTRALGTDRSAPKASKARSTKASVGALTKGSAPVPPQGLGQTPTDLMRQAAAQAVAEGNWALVDQLRPLLTPPEGVASLDAARAKRGRK